MDITGGIRPVSRGLSRSQLALSSTRPLSSGSVNLGDGVTMFAARKSSGRGAGHSANGSVDSALESFYNNKPTVAPQHRHSEALQKVKSLQDLHRKRVVRNKIFNTSHEYVVPSKSLSKTVYDRELEHLLREKHRNIERQEQLLREQAQNPWGNAQSVSRPTSSAGSGGIRSLRPLSRGSTAERPRTSGGYSRPSSSGGYSRPSSSGGFKNQQYPSNPALFNTSTYSTSFRPLTRAVKRPDLYSPEAAMWKLLKQETKNKPDMTRILSNSQNLGALPNEERSAIIDLQRAKENLRMQIAARFPSMKVCLRLLSRESNFLYRNRIDFMCDTFNLRRKEFLLVFNRADRWGKNRITVGEFSAELGKDDVVENKGFSWLIHPHLDKDIMVQNFGTPDLHEEEDLRSRRRRELLEQIETRFRLLKDAWYHLDHMNAGCLQREDIRTLAQKHGLSADTFEFIFDCIDEEKTGRITFNQFAQELGTPQAENERRWPDTRPLTALHARRKGRGLMVPKDNKELIEVDSSDGHSSYYFVPKPGEVYRGLYKGGEGVEAPPNYLRTVDGHGLPKFMPYERDISVYAEQQKRMMLAKREQLDHDAREQAWILQQMNKQKQKQVERGTINSRGEYEERPKTANLAANPNFVDAAANRENARARSRHGSRGQ
jgi:hypothetical protein